MTVAVTARSAGKVTLSVIGDRLITQTTTDVQPGLVKLPLTVGEDWGTGAYVLATLRRPLDEAEKRMPGRAIGVQWFSIDKAAHTIGVALDLPALIRPETTLRVPVKLAGLAPDEEARIVVSAVDVGILNLTNYKAPDPDDYYLGQRKLSAEVRDLYGQLIDGMQGTKGEIRTGGDCGEGELQGSPPTQPPLAFYSGIVTVGPDGTAEVNFDIPAFSGTVRVMAVGLEQGQDRPCLGRCRRARSGGGHGHAAALPADRRQEHAPARSRQCRGRDRRLSDRRHHRRTVERRRRRQDAHARRQEARRGHAAGLGDRRRHGHGRGRRQRARRLHARARISARGAARRRRSLRAAR